MIALRASAAALLAATLLSACKSESDPTPAEASSCDGPAPVAVAGPDRTVARGTEVRLQGGAGATEGTVSYLWRLEALPAGSAASLSSASEAQPTFIADAPGVYVASVTVTDACATSAPDVSVIVVPNAPPMASPGLDVNVLPGASVVLDGGGSVDPDGDALTFAWTLVTRPQGSVATLSGATGETASFVADAPGTYLAVLVVSDGFERSAPAAVAVQAVDPSPEPTCPARPVANAGPDQTFVPYPYYYSKTVTLNGGASSGSGATLTYRWVLVERPSSSGAYLNYSSSMAPTLSLDRSGSYVVALIVNDGCQDSEPDFVTVTAPNHAPTATISYGWRDVATGVSFSLSGSGQDQDNDPLTFEWTLVSAPEGSTAKLSSTAVQYPTLVTDVDGEYVVSLVVRDGELASTPATATFRSLNATPIAAAGADRGATTGATVKLDASASTDANRTPLVYAWSLAKVPPGSAATLSGADTAVASLVPDVTGIYLARVVVSDGVLSASDDVVISVWPAVQRLAYRVVDAEYSRALDRIVAVSADPSLLRAYDPLTRAETTIALPLPPGCVSVSPNGLLAAVGHANAISIVDLETGALEEVSVSVEVADVAIADDGRAFAISRTAGTEKARVVAIAAGAAETYGSSGQSGTVRAKLRPGAAALYVSGTGYPASVERFDVSGAPVLDASSSSYSACGELWLSEAGTRIFTRCGTVLRASSASAEDLMFAGTLTDGSGPNARVTARHLDDSTAANELSAITSAFDGYYSYDDDVVLRRYESASLGLVETARLPLETLNGRAYAWRGRYVFYRSDGTERYVVMQLDPTSGALFDFGLATF